MRENTSNSKLMFDELTKTATGTEPEPYELSFGSGEETSGDIEQDLDKLLEQVHSALPADTVQFDEAIIKENLEEVLLLLITLHEGTHGKELLSDLTHHFGTQLSPGTVYPCLHELEEDDVLAMHAKVRTKEYSIADDEYVRATIEQTMVQHLAFGLLLYAFLPELQTDGR